MPATTERALVMKDCPDCHGDGKRLGMRGYPGTGAHRPVVECRRCAGTGRVRKNPPRKKYPATSYMLEQGDHDIIIDFLRGMLSKQGMSGKAIDAALDGECARWLREQREEWWEA